MFDKNTKILGVFAHREDHIVCGWPIFQNRVPRKFLVTCTSDGMEPFLQSCSKEGISCFKRIGLPNSFSLMGYGLRPEHSVQQIQKVLADADRAIEPDFVFTHNPYGEYGHFDHRILFDIVCEALPNRKILFTDIIAKSSCTPISNIRLRAYRSLFRGTHFTIIKPDVAFYARNAELFAGHEMWTTNPALNLPEYPNEPADLYIMEPSRCQRGKK